MGLRAAELLNAPPHAMTIVSSAPPTQPVSCLNDGLLVATGSTPGRGLFPPARSARHRRGHLRLQRRGRSSAAEGQLPRADRRRDPGAARAITPSRTTATGRACGARSRRLGELAPLDLFDVRPQSSRRRLGDDGSGKALRWRRTIGSTPVLAAVPRPHVGAAASRRAGSPATTPKDASTGDQQVFSGAVTVRDTPIIEGSDRPAGHLVTTVSEQQIDDLYAQDLTSALRRVPGVVISRYNPIGAFGGGDGGAVLHPRPRLEPTGRRDHHADRRRPSFRRDLDPPADRHRQHRRGRSDRHLPQRPAGVARQHGVRGGRHGVQATHESGSGGRFVGSYGSYDTLIGTVEYGGRSEPSTTS